MSCRWISVHELSTLQRCELNNPYSIMKDHQFLLPSIVLALGLIVSVVIFTWSWKEAKDADQTITVTGSAKKDIASDLGILRGSIAIEAATPEAAWQALKAQKPILLEYLNAQGFPESVVTFFPVISNPVYEYNTDGAQTKVRAHACSQRMEIQSGDVQKIRRLSLDIASVIERGVYFHVEAPEYYYTKLAGVKIQIQSEAAQDAKVRAERIVTATGRGLGPLRTARMGVLQITAKNSNQVSDYGVNDVTSIEKEITAVVNASFQIR
jgi:uncharacterized protein